jgi:hypothetical protein
MYRWRAALPRSRVKITHMIEDPGKRLRGSATFQYRRAGNQRQKM